MAAAYHQHNIAFAELARGHQMALIVVNIHFATALTDDHDFRSADQMALEREVNVTLNFAARGIDHVTELLLVLRRRQEGSALRKKAAFDDIGEALLFPEDFLYQVGTLAYLCRR